MGTYIHYGSTEFNRNCYNEVRNYYGMVTKPSGGFWASPTDAEYGWKDWCESAKFCECSDEKSFTFALSENANILHLYSVSDLESLPKYEDEIFTSNIWVTLDFEKIRESGIDAIELHLSEDSTAGSYGLYFALYGWDCDCIFIMNPDIVIV